MSAVPRYLRNIVVEGNYGTGSQGSQGSVQNELLLALVDAQERTNEHLAVFAEASRHIGRSDAVEVVEDDE
jgi:hypothetical protein